MSDGYLAQFQKTKDARKSLENITFKEVEEHTEAFIDPEKRPRFMDDSSLSFQEKIRREKKWIQDHRDIRQAGYLPTLPAVEIPEIVKIGAEIAGAGSIGHTLHQGWKEFSKKGGSIKNMSRASIITSSLAATAFFTEWLMHDNHKILEEVREANEKIKWLDKLEEERAKLEKYDSSSPQRS